MAYRLLDPNSESAIAKAMQMRNAGVPESTIRQYLYGDFSRAPAADSSVPSPAPQDDPSLPAMYMQPAHTESVPFWKEYSKQLPKTETTTTEDRTPSPMNVEDVIRHVIPSYLAARSAIPTLSTQEEALQKLKQTQATPAQQDTTMTAAAALAPTIDYLTRGTSSATDLAKQTAAYTPKTPEQKRAQQLEELKGLVQSSNNLTDKDIALLQHFMPQNSMATKLAKHVTVEPQGPETMHEKGTVPKVVPGMHGINPASNAKDYLNATANVAESSQIIKDADALLKDPELKDLSTPRSGLAGVWDVATTGAKGALAAGENALTHSDQGTQTFFGANQAKWDRLRTLMKAYETKFLAGARPNATTLKMLNEALAGARLGNKQSAADALNIMKQVELSRVSRAGNAFPIGKAMVERGEGAIDVPALRNKSIPAYPGDTPVGSLKEGKSGTYRRLPGPENDPKSWQKVQ